MKLFQWGEKKAARLTPWDEAMPKRELYSALQRQQNFPKRKINS
jgi:hypothetical protein